MSHMLMRQKGWPRRLWPLAGAPLPAMANVAEATTVEMMVARAEKEPGPVTILVNNAVERA
jgi:NAD(P)-dependent dehydrogenase (short-subunit alcohol dehydrogenase family)